MKKLVIALSASAALTACKAENPALMGPGPQPAPVQYAPAKPDPRSFDKTFVFASSEFTGEQANYNQNNITVNFTVTGKDGKSVNDLKKKDLKVTDGGVNVTPFELLKAEQRKDEVADIVFMVDQTKSMGPFIEDAKLRLKQFIGTTNARGYRIRMCLSSFGDYVTKACTRFYSNESKEQIAEFNHELSQLHATDDKRDTDYNENPMRALYNISAAQWAEGSKRFVILVTDADFYSPDKGGERQWWHHKKAFVNDANYAKELSKHQANPDTVAPHQAQVWDVIKNSGLRVFAITPSVPGYNSDFAGLPGVASSGQWFDFDKVVRGGQSIDPILDNILQEINTTYTLKYTVEKVQGLNPTVPLAQRNIQIAGPGTVAITGADSTMRDGRPEYQKTWTISDSTVDAGSAQVFVNGKEVKRGEYDIQGANITFKSVPQPGSKIKVSFMYEASEKNFRLEPLIVQGAVDRTTTKVYLNGKEAREGDIRFDRTAEGNTSISLTPQALDPQQDPYEIRRNQGLRIQAITNFTM